MNEDCFVAGCQSVVPDGYIACLAHMTLSTMRHYASQLEQQLADAQAKIARQEAEIRILAAQRQDKQAQLAEARTLIEEAEAVIDSHWGDETAIHRSPHVVLNRLRAFLQKIGG